VECWTQTAPEWILKRPACPQWKQFSQLHLFLFGCNPFTVSLQKRIEKSQFEFYFVVVCPAHSVTAHFAATAQSQPSQPSQTAGLCEKAACEMAEMTPEFSVLTCSAGFL
jgi:hypothetical protein